MKEVIKQAAANPNDMASTSSDRPEVKEKLAAAASATRDAGEAVVHEVRDRAVEAFDAVGDAALKRAEDARTALSDAGERLASGLRHAATEARPDSFPAKSLNAMADGVVEAAHSIRSHDVPTILGDVTAFARRHPAAFALGAACAGFALVRLLKAEPQADSRTQG